MKNNTKGGTTMYRITMVNITKLLDELWTEFNDRLDQIIELDIQGGDVNVSDEIWKIYDEWWDYLKTLKSVKLLSEEEFVSMIHKADDRCTEVIAIHRERED